LKPNNPTTPPIKPPNNPSTKKTFANSLYKQYYDETRVPKFHYVVLTAIEALIDIYQKEYKDTITDKEAENFLENLHKQTMSKATKDELIGQVEIISILLWTSGRSLKGKELCSILNYAIRSDKEEYIKSAIIFSKGINSLCVTRNNKSLNNWPENNITYRGGGFPNDDKRDFFKPNTKYRAPMFIATSFQERVARNFSNQAQINGFPPVIWYFHFDPKLGCVHVNYIPKSLVEGEDEFLFTAYSVFIVKGVSWKEVATYEEPNEIHLFVAPDNLSHPEDLPLAPWC